MSYFCIMAKRAAKKTNSRKIHRKRKQKWRFRRYALLALLLIACLVTGFYLKEKVKIYIALNFSTFHHRKLKNTASEEARIHRIVSDYSGKTFGIDMSHYQQKQDIKWDSLSIGNGAIPIKFVVLRATMGNRSADRNFEDFWMLAKKHELIRGAYHFYRADEDPVVQANNFLKYVKLESGDLPPILDIERIPRRKTNERLVQDLKTWCSIMEETYGEKPIIYTYYHYYKDYLKGEFDGYPLWLANYNDVPEPTPNDDWHLWQFTENGIVYGINTKVDLNIFNGSLWSLKRLTID